MNTGQADGQDQTTSDKRLDREELRHEKLNHDIRASLAITKGFNQALESSFSELCESFEKMQSSDIPSVNRDVELEDRVEQLKADCRFCLSRINRSLIQLEARITSDSRLNSDNSTSDHVDIL